MRIKDILKGIEIKEFIGNENNDISSLAYDSRKVEKNGVFCAIPGNKQNGLDFVNQAYEKGAILIVAEKMPEQIRENISYAIVASARAALSRMAANWYGHPENKLHIVGVTGTNGKTTTTKLIKWLWEYYGQKSGLLGTINNMAGGKVIKSTHTTPESLELFELFDIMLDEDCRNVVMEVSSHALDQDRVADVKFTGAVFTNLTQDHLDYHGTMENYLKAKIKLFEMIRPDGYGVINADDDNAEAFIRACRGRIFTYGMKENSVFRIREYHIDTSGTAFTVEYNNEIYKMHTPLTGRFNIYNTAAAACCALAEGMSMHDIAECIKHSPQVAGRFEKVDRGQDFTVVVDYAHTPDGLQNVLQTARELKPQRLIAVFGCGGDRDNSKRPIMGEIGEQLADYCIITSDNPRTEDPESIIKMVVAGIKDKSEDKYKVIVSRHEAIQYAVNMAEKGDIIVIAGKGHEDYQILGTQKVHFDDREEAAEAIARRAE